MIRFAMLALAALLAWPVQAAELVPYGRGSFAAVLRAHAGRPLAVHFWALSCAPCLVELPRWAGLARRFPDLDIVLVNTDPPDAAPAVSATLDRMGLARATNMAFADRFTQRLWFEVDPEWRGELPRTDLVSRTGAVTPVLGGIDDTMLADWVRHQ